ncbi:unnamed protein product, partial [Allacma fusca]
KSVFDRNTWKMFSGPRSNRQDRTTMGRGRGTPTALLGTKSGLGYGTPVKNQSRGMTLKEKLHTLENLKESEDGDGTNVFKTLLKVITAKDEPEPTPGLSLKQEASLMKRINFDAEMS